MKQTFEKIRITYKLLLRVYFILIFFFSPSYTFSQTKDSIIYIVFDLQHALRIPDHHIIVDIRKSNQNVMLHLLSFPLKQFETKYPKTDTSFMIDIAEYRRLAQSVSLLNNLDTTKAAVHGFDGAYCKVHYGSTIESHFYNVWSPEFDTNQRGLNDYFNACYAIIRVAHLPFKVLL